MSAAPTHAEPTTPTSRVVNPGRSLAVLTMGAAMMQAAVMAASTASTLMFAGVFGDRWGGTQLLALGGFQLLATACVTLVAVTLLPILRTRIAPDHHTPDRAVMPNRRSR